MSDHQSLLDTSSTNAVTLSSEIELRADEDSVTTLAVGQRKGRTSLVYAGINSSDEDMKKGKNEHFRVLGVDQASKAKSNTGPKISELSRSSFFNSMGTSSYQRVLRLSPTYTEAPYQVGAAATGSTGASKGGEIAVFDVATAGSPAPKVRGKIEVEKETADLDIISVSEDAWQLAYCDDHELHVMDIGKKSVGEPNCVFTMTADEAIGSTIRPSFRSVRYLTSTSVLTVSNLPKAGGAVLHGFRLPTTPGGKARLAASAKLPKNVTRATGLAVRNLTPAPAAGRQASTQFAIAVAGQDYSITVYTLDHEVMGDVGLMANLHPIATLKADHPSPISGLAFSHLATTPAKSTAAHLKLASIGSMGNTVVVHNIPLRRVNDKTRRAGPPRPPRYVVALGSMRPGPAGLLIGTAIAMLLLAILLQGVMEIKGLSRTIVGGRYVVPERWNNPVIYGRAVGAAEEARQQQQQQGFLADLLARSSVGEGAKVVLSADGVESVVDAEDAKVVSGGVKVDAHDVERHGDAMEWDELPAEQREAWKERLQEAGHWAEEMGETVFKGVLFANLAGVVGNIVAG